MPRIVEHPTDADEAAWVARQAWLAHTPGRRWAQLAVLARTNAQLAPVAEALAAARIPWQSAGADLGPASDVRRDRGPDPGCRPTTSMMTTTTSPTTRGRSPRPATRVRVHGGGVRRAGAGDAVVLTTFHRAKGLQWPVVFVVGLCEGLVPIGSARTPAALDEERRLLYVALTRAEDELSVSWARQRGTGAPSVGGQAPGRAAAVAVGSSRWRVPGRRWPPRPPPRGPTRWPPTWPACAPDWRPAKRTSDSSPGRGLAGPTRGAATGHGRRST